MKKRFLLFIVVMSMMGLLQASSNPTLSRVYGNQFTPEIYQTQLAGAIGSLDGTFGSGGSLNVNGINSGGQGAGIQALPNGNFFVVVSGATSQVGMYNAEGTYQAAYSLTTPSASPLATMIDAQGRLLVAGGANSGSLGWINRVSTTGTATAFTGGTWRFVGGLAQQSTGAIIAVGFNGTNAQIARYTVAGALDTANFGTSGVVALSGSGSVLPTVTTGLYSVVVDANNYIYVAFIASATAHSFTSGSAYIARFTPVGVFDTTWGSSGILNLSALNSATSGLYVAQNHDGNFIVGAQVSTNVKVTGVTSAGGAISGFTTFSTSTINSNTFTITDLITTSDDSIFILGSDTTSSPIQMAVIRLVGATGALDTAFNGTGYKLFSISGGTITTSTITAASVASDGQIYTTGYQTVSGPTTTPYVSRLNNTQYVTQVAQFPAAQEQGILDLTFGATGIETYAGVTTPFNGLYGPLLQQRVACAIEMIVSGAAITQGNIIVGMNGFLGAAIPTYNPNPADSNMMLAFLNQEGAVNTALGTSGYVTLQNLSGTGPNEYMTAMLEDGLGNLYLSGYTSTSTAPTLPGNSANQSAFLRAYPTSSSITGIASWSAPQATVGWQGVGVSLQSNRTLLCVDEGSGIGHITSYIAGTLDTTFGDSGSGTINSTSFTLHMGPCYGLAVNLEGYIYAAYVDSSNSQVNVVAFELNGSELVPTFGASGIVANIFLGATVAANNVRIGFTTGGNLVVGAVTSTGILVAFVNAKTGAVITSTSTQITITGATTLHLTRLTGVSDGTVLFTFWDSAGTKYMYVARVTSASAIDTTFNSQGVQAGVLPIVIGTNFTVNDAASALVQSYYSGSGTNYTGNIVVAGYESVTTSDAIPIAMRVYGDGGSTEILDYSFGNSTAGEFETAYNLTSAISAGAGNVIFTYPSTNLANAGKLLIGIDNGTTTIVARVYELDMSLDTSTAGGNIPFNGSTGYFTVSSPSLRGISTISIDGNNNIVIGGTSSGTPWAQVINNAGTSSTSFTMPSGITQVNQILQQESGRYIVAGTATGGRGLLVAFQDALVYPATTLAVDTSFNPLLVNPLATGSAPTAGSFYVGAAGLYTMAINTTYNASPLCNIDTIVVAYSVSGTVNIAEITADGSGVVFGATATGVTTDSSATIRLNIDGSQNIVVGASYNNGGTHQVQVQRFDAAGSTSAQFTNGGIVSGHVATISNLGTGGVTLTNLMATTTQQTVLTGYNSAGGHGRLFAARLNSTGGLDSNWNVGFTSTDSLGVLTYATSSAIDINDSAIALDGTILSIGATNVTPSSSAPIVTKVVGDALVTQVTQDPLQSASGTLDLTIPGNVSGALNLASPTALVTGLPQKIYIYNTAINSSPNGAMLIASTSGASVYLTQLNQDLSLNTNFATGTSNKVTLTPNAGAFPISVTINDMYVANGTNGIGTIYLCGYTTPSSGPNTPFAVQVAYDGSGTPVYVSPASTLTSMNGIRQSSNSRVLVSGYNGSSGAVVAYNSTMTAIDTSFGNGTGYYTTSVANPISAMATDNDDRIYIAYANVGGSTMIVQRVLENGTAVDTSFNTSFVPTFPTAASYPTGVTNQIKMAIDLTNNMIVVAVQNATGGGNILQVARFYYGVGTIAAGGTSDITMSSKALNLADLFIDSDQFIYVIGNNTTDNQSIVARIISQSSSSIALDPTYAAAVTPTPAGIANIAVGAGLMTLTTSGMLDPDGRVYLVGSGSSNGYMGRIFNNQWNAELSPAIVQGVVGALDLTLTTGFGIAGTTGALDVSTITNWSSLAGTSKAQAIIENNGGSFIAFVVSGYLVVGQLDADMNPVTTFGGLSTGLTPAATVAMSTVNSMMRDVSGNIIVAGINSSLQTLVIFNSSGIVQAVSTNSLSATSTTVAQQKSGRYLVGGSSSSNSAVFAYKNASAIVSPGSSGTLALDQTFGPAGSNGFYSTTHTGQVDDLVIDSNDYVYIVYRVSNTVTLAKLTPEGSLVSAYNTPSTPTNEQWSTNPITTSITATQPARIAINGAGNILVGASVLGGFSTALYNGFTGGTAIGTQTKTLSNSPVLTKLVGSVGSTNEFYGSMYTTAPTAGVFAITSAGALDTAGFDVNVTPGYLLTNVASVKQLNGLTVQPDGKIVMVGYNGTGSTDPLLIRVYGYPYVSQFAQGQAQVAAGQLDTTLWPTIGAFLLDNTSNGPFNSALTGYAVQRVYESGNGLMTFVADNGNNTIIFQLLKDLTVNTAFNSSVTPGYVSLPTNYGGTTCLFVNTSNENFIAGNKSGVPWLQGVSAAGVSLVPPLSISGFMVSIQAVSQQALHRIIVAGLGSIGTGQANGNGCLIGLTVSGTPDHLFGVSGNVDMGSTNTITDITVDQYNNIITVANNSGTVILQKVTQIGVPTNISSAGTAITGAVGNIKVALDASDDIVVAAATATGYIVRSYINNTTGSGSASGTNNASSAVPITAGSAGYAVLSNMYATSDGKITLIGYDSSTGQAIVARLLSSGTGVSGSGTLQLDTTFNTALTGGGTPQAGVLITAIGSSMNQFFDGVIHADDRIMLVGSESSSAAPYMGRIFGDLYATLVPQAPTVGVPGTLDTTFGSGTPPTGYYDLSTLGSSALNNSLGKAILSVSTGGYYMVVDNGTNSLLLRTLVNGSLDPSFNPTPVTYPQGIAQSPAPTGTNSMMMNGSNQILLVGTNGSGGWVQRYQSGNSGAIDTTFATSGVLQVGAGTTATVAVEQTLGRLVVAGINAAGQGTLFAYTSLDPSGTPGTIDTTFNSLGTAGTTGVPGTFTTGVSLAASYGIYDVIADQYDRLIFASLNVAGTAIDLYRLTPSGELDVTFGSNGKSANVLTTNTGGLSPNNASSIRVALDSAGNIVVAAYTYNSGSNTDAISIVACNNGIVNSLGVNGYVYTHSYPITNLAGSGKGMSLTGLATSSYGDVLVLGNQLGSSSATSPTWVARFRNTVSSATYALDTLFNPAGLNGAGVPGGVQGIFEYTNTAGTYSPYNVYNGMVINYIGELGIIGYEQNGSTSYIPSLLQIYDDPYTLEESQSPNSKPVGTNDLTLGVSPASTAAQGVTFFGASGNAASGQVARAVALQDDNTIIVAIDGHAATGSGVSDIMINMFDNDGLANLNFGGSTGTATALTYYNSQYVKDMVTFTTPSPSIANKAILAGYATNASAGITGSLVLQYNLSTSSIDSSFGGFDGNPSGVAFGDGYQAFAVGQQTSGRIIIGGIAQGGAGLLLGYTSTGKLDQSFGNSGYQSTNTGGTGIYSHVIDSENRIVIAYNSGGTLEIARFLADGSGLDTTFNSPHGYITTNNITGLQSTVNNNLKVVLDGSGNVIAAAITGDGTTSHTITVSSYSSDGTTRNYTNSFTGASIGGTSSSTYTMSRLLVDAQAHVIVVAYDSHPTPNTILVMQLVSALTLDTTIFNAPNGYITYQVSSGNTQVATDALIHPDGRIMVVGSEI